jgi:Subtilase family
MMPPWNARRRSARTSSAILLGLAWSLFAAAAGQAAIQPAEGVLSPRLAELAKPTVRDAPPAEQARDLGVAPEGPGSLLREGSRVLVDVRFEHGAIAALPALRAAGSRVLSSSGRYQSATVAMDPADLKDLEGVPGVASVTESRAPLLFSADEPPCEGGSVISEGLGQLKVDEAREAFGLRGRGITVGVLSDSFDVATGAADGSGPVATHADQDIASDDLPGPAGTCSGQQLPVDVLAEGPSGGEDEGRAMLQIVHDLAPHASLAFATAFQSEESFARNIERLAEPVSEGGAGANVIVDDVAWFEEPFFQDGPVSDAINKVTAEGVVYLTAAGNNNLFDSEGHEIASWEAPQFRDAGSCPAALAAFEAESKIHLHPTHCMDFDPGPGADTTFGIRVSKGATLLADLQWAEPWEGVGTDLDAFLIGPNGKVAEASIADNPGDGRPFEFVRWKNETGAAAEVNLAINRYSGGDPRLKFALLENGGGVTATEYPESSGGDVVGPTVFGHAGDASAITLGAVRYDDDAQPEPYSSRGPVTHYFAPVEGTAPAAALESPEAIDKPDLVATDCGATTFFAQQVAGAWRFCGTSAAAPHAAAIAALLLQGKPGATPAEVRTAMTDSAGEVGAFPPDAVGAGLVDADGAMALLGISPSAEDPASTVVSPLESTPGESALGESAPAPTSTLPPTVASTSTPALSTSLKRHPSRLVSVTGRSARLVFRFAANEQGVVFLCEVDGGPLHLCPVKFVHRFPVGGHVLRVEARDQAGEVDSTPAVFRFQVKRRRGG